METNQIYTQQLDLYINGQFSPAYHQGYFDVVNPSNGEIFAQVADGAKEDMQKAINIARDTFDKGIWSNLSFKERGQYLSKIAQFIREEAKLLADLEAMDTGKTIKQTTFIDIPTAADTFEYFAHVNDQLQGQTLRIDAPVFSFSQREPFGVIGCIIPWNYPLIMFAWKVAPALITGNTLIFKPSALASVAIMKLVQIIHKVGLPPGVLNVVSTNSNEVAAELVRNSKVDMISFTGSNLVGQKVMTQAADTTKKLIMELGGKSPNIVFADCNFDSAIGGTLSAIFMNQGQMCTAGSRLLLEDKIYDKFLETLVQRTKALKIGNALDYQTDFGPVICENHKDHILQYIKNGVREGAQLLCGGGISLGDDLSHGYFVEPTILKNVTSEMSIAQEEIFGPVLSVIKFSNIKEAIQIANDTKYGLAACLWTKDIQKANEISKKLRCGTIWVNTYGGFYNQAPFGGYKQSGFGRELGHEGLLEYTQTKHICVDTSPGGRSLVSSWF